ncbi:ribonuclease h1 [Plakobranchus ocellatus]|uniref:ribonuclease H n=1 Tax=Plakobranchus ocellatus TaxID=259542 RepID=A0AAV3ZJ81_9GAST|nr:ribonuclease h1 [Plakobranchus ocellatus]
MSKPGSKRASSPSVDDAEDTKGTKQPKENAESDAFTGTKFSDGEGTSVYTDGACFFNGKQGHVAGVGVYWAADDVENVSEALPGSPSNHRAEIYAAVRAIQIAKKRGVDKLILHTDSQYLINGITKWMSGWKKREWKTSAGEPVKNKEDFEALDKETADISIKWVYSKSKSGIEACDEADKLAKKGAGLKDKVEKQEKEEKSKNGAKELAK